MTKDEIAALSDGLSALQRETHQRARDKGFWPDTSTTGLGLKAALIGSEANELLEAIRDGSANHSCAKTPALSNAGEELADIVIRAADLAEAMGVDLAHAIALKHEYNAGRSHKHGKAF